MNEIKINNKNYKIINTKEKMTVPDCFVLRSNKIGSGNGEAKFYIGNENKETRDFFGEKKFKIQCFLLKKDLLQYLKECETEYKNPEQQYRKKDFFENLFKERVEKITSLKDDILYFSLDEQDQIKGSRIYVKSNDKAYQIIRELSLPNVTYISAIKLVDDNGKIIYYFKLFIDYFGENEHPSVINQEEKKIKDKKDSNEEDKKQLVRARKGQGKYRKDLLEECPFCPITLISDDRLLIASHIKPWVHSNQEEKIDPKNGFMFTPTFDFLFDRGYISFTDDKKIIISPWLSKMTCSKLNIFPDKIFSMLPTENRENYLEYHRKFVFKI